MQLLAAVFVPLGQPAAAPKAVVHDSRASVQAPGVHLAARRAGSAVDVTVRGDDLARVWRLTIAGAGALSTHRIVVTVETSDVGFAGGLVAWNGTKRIASHALGSAFQYCDRDLAICMGSKGLTLPAGNATIAVHATTSRYVAYRVTGAVREAHDAAFVFGSWLATKAVAI